LSGISAVVGNVLLARPSACAFRNRNRKALANKAKAARIHTLSCQQRHTLPAVQIAKSEIVAHIISAPPREREQADRQQLSEKYARTAARYVVSVHVCKYIYSHHAPCVCERASSRAQKYSKYSLEHTRRFVVYLHSCVSAARVSQQTNEPLQCCWRSQLFAQQTQDVSSLAGEVCARERERALCERGCERIAGACLGGNAAQLITFPAQIMRACALYACVRIYVVVCILM
jgi:hypothetical protein